MRALLAGLVVTLGGVAPLCGQSPCLTDSARSTQALAHARATFELLDTLAARVDSLPPWPVALTLVTEAAECTALLAAIGPAGRKDGMPAPIPRAYVVTADGRAYYVEPGDDPDMSYLLDRRRQLRRVLVALD